MSAESGAPDKQIEHAEDAVGSRLADDAIIGLQQILAGEFVADDVLDMALGALSEPLVTR